MVDSFGLKLEAIRDTDFYRQVETLHTLTCAQVEAILPGGCDRSMFNRNGNWNPKHLMLGYETRRWYTSRYSFSLPCSEAIEAIALHTTIICGYVRLILDPMAGTGWWAKVLRARASDNGERKDFETKWLDVAEGDAAEEVKRFPKHLIFLSWPPLHSDADAKVYEAMVPGQKLCLIGEGQGGCTGSDEGFSYLEEKFTEIEEIQIPQFWGIHDYMRILVKNE